MFFVVGKKKKKKRKKITRRRQKRTFTKTQAFAFAMADERGLVRVAGDVGVERLSFSSTG